MRIRTPLTEAFARAIVQPALDSACDALLGPGRWVRKAHVGGTVPVRFPHADDPGDAGWHIDGSYDVDGAWWVNVRSRWRGLLALYLFSDVELEDAPTEVKVGSHLDIPPVLVVFGDTGVPFEAVSASLLATTLDRPSAFVTGSAGDVYLCHPFLLHRATWPHRGCRPRAIAQPEVPHNDPFVLDGVDPCPVEEAILRGLGGPI